jgi:hypothetical protein
MTVLTGRVRPSLMVSVLVVLGALAGCFAVSTATRDDAAPAGPPITPGGTLAPYQIPSAAPPAAGLPSAAGSVPGSAPGVAPRPDPGGPFFGAQLQAAPPLADIRQDEGLSVALPDGRTLYIFADTLHLDTKPRFFATSSAAITEPGDPLKLHYATDARGVPLEFLPRDAAESADQVQGVKYHAVWPTGATTLPDGRIIISYGKYDIVIADNSITFRGAGLFEYRYTDAPGFRNGGVSRRIADDIWLTDTGAVGSPVYHDGYVYFTVCENLECYSLRVRPESLSSRASYKWWTGSGWSASKVDRRRMSFGGSRPGHNPSVVWVPAVNAFVMADTEAGSVAPSGLLWVAPNPWGPWSEPASVGLTRCSVRGCYGLNVHAHASSRRSLRVSYSPVMVNRVGPFVYLIDQAVKVSNGGRRITTSSD